MRDKKREREGEGGLIRQWKQEAVRTEVKEKHCLLPGSEQLALCPNGPLRP